jgi:hypothetical protein
MSVSVSLNLRYRGQEMVSRPSLCSQTCSFARGWCDLNWIKNIFFVRGCGVKVADFFVAFILYRQHHQQAIIARNPGLNNPDISKIIGEQWKAEGEESKKVWQDLAQVSTVLCYHRNSADILCRRRKSGITNSTPTTATSLVESVSRVRPRLIQLFSILRSTNTAAQGAVDVVSRHLPAPIQSPPEHRHCLLQTTLKAQHQRRATCP